MILSTTFQYPFYKDEILPIGNLRENKDSSKRADIIVVTKCPIDMHINDKKTIIESLNPLANQKVFFSTLTYKQKIKSDVDQINIDTFTVDNESLSVDTQEQLEQARKIAALN